MLITELKRQPAVPTVRLRAVAKTDDVVPGTGETVDDALRKLAAPIKDARGDENAAAGIIKALHAMGGKAVKF